MSIRAWDNYCTWTDEVKEALLLDESDEQLAHDAIGEICQKRKRGKNQIHLYPQDFRVLWIDSTESKDDLPF